MPKIPHAGRSRWFWVFVLVSSLVVPALDLGAQTNTLNVKVKVVEVIKTGTAIQVNPVKVKVKRKEEIVVWVTNGLALKVEFKKGNPAPGNPFTDLTCKGRYCAALTPPDVAPAVFQYKVTVDGVVLDPNVEVVP
jgi:hypothetical protein